MANRYDELFSRLKKEGRKAFIPYTLLGYPDGNKSFKAIETMIKGGAAALELGLAFSDPLADGPVIQQASAETIEAGFKLKDAFELIEKIRKIDNKIPITVMCYYNSILSLGLDGFCRNAADCGVDGLLAVDLPPEQSDLLAAQCKASGLCQIFIISPLTSEQRMHRISELASGFLYAVSRLGTTGVEERYDENLANLIVRAQNLSKLPVAVGFGVSTPEQAANMYKLGADAVVTGSRVIELIKELSVGKTDENSFLKYIQSMSNAELSVTAKSPS